MPAGMRDVDVIFLFPPGCPPIADIQRESKQATKAFVAFGSPTDAQLAFDMLDGRVVPDSRRRAQKLVPSWPPIIPLFNVMVLLLIPTTQRLAAGDSRGYHPCDFVII